MTRRESAEAHFREGYNCAQAVALTFADVAGVDRETLMRLSSSFGGGMGRLREVCGAVSGMLIIEGLLEGYDGPETGAVKAEHYARIQQLAHAFAERKGSIVCREILGLGAGASSPEPTPRTAEFYEKRPCGDCIGTAAEILEDFLRAREIL